MIHRDYLLRDDFSPSVWASLDDSRPRSSGSFEVTEETLLGLPLLITDTITALCGVVLEESLLRLSSKLEGAWNDVACS